MNHANLNRAKLTLVILFLMLPAGVGRADAADILGRHWLPDRDGQFEIHEASGCFHGRVVAYDVEGQLDENNLDPSLRTRSFVGMEMFRDFRFDARSGMWVDGTIYDASNGKTYDCRIWFEPEDPNTLIARGFIGFSIFGRNERFERVTP